MISLAELRVTDLKQYAYCQRIPFYQHVMGFTGKPTYKMERGRDAQTAIEARSGGGNFENTVSLKAAGISVVG